MINRFFLALLNRVQRVTKMSSELMAPKRTKDSLGAEDCAKKAKFAQQVIYCNIFN